MTLRELDPVPNPPYFSSYVIKATLDYLSKCHSANHKSLVAILSKTPVRRPSCPLYRTTCIFIGRVVFWPYKLVLPSLLCPLDFYPEDSAGGVWKSGRDDQQLRTPSHPPHVSPVCQPAAQRGEGRPGRSLGLRPQRHHLHTHSPYQQQVSAHTNTHRSHTSNMLCRHKRLTVPSSLTKFVFLSSSDRFSVMRFLTEASLCAATCWPLCVGQLCSSVMMLWTATCRSSLGLSQLRWPAGQPSHSR